jgi:hypothetical protein
MVKPMTETGSPSLVTTAPAAPLTRTWWIATAGWLNIAARLATSADGRQPAAGIVHVIRPRAADPHPGVLKRVVGLGRRSEHPVAQAVQAGPVLLELPGQPVIRVHPSHPSRARCHQPVVTRRATPL